MKLIIRIIAIGVLTYFLSHFGSWWICMAASFVVCFLLPSSGLNAFIAGFLGVGLVWLGHAWNLDVQNASLFSNKVAEVMQMGEPLILIIISGVVGGLAGGFSAMTGSSFRKIFAKKQKTSFYS